MSAKQKEKRYIIIITIITSDEGSLLAKALATLPPSVQTRVLQLISTKLSKHPVLNIITYGFQWIINQAS